MKPLALLNDFEKLPLLIEDSKILENTNPCKNKRLENVSSRKL